MTFERYIKKGYHDNMYHCSISRDGKRITFSAGLPREMNVIPCSVTLFFDLTTNRVALELHEEIEPGAYRLRSAGNAYCFSSGHFTRFHRINPHQAKLKATIEEVDGKRMIVFPVEVEVSQ